MKVCALCLQNEADKTGSHLVPHFLVKAVDNIDGKPGRDLELGFKITSGSAKGYFGRAVQPEKLEEVFGELSEKQILDSRSELIVDHLLCSGCEKRLGELESIYAQIDKKTEQDEYQSTDDSFLATTFSSSILWRVSVSDSMGVKLDGNHESQLRIILNDGLDTGNRKQFVSDQKYGFTKIRYKIMKCPNYLKASPGYIHFSQANINVYNAIIGETAIEFYFDHAETREAFYGLEEFFEKAKVNNCESGEVIYTVPDEAFDGAVEKIIAFLSLNFLSDLSGKLEGLHKHFGGTGEMDRELKKAILNEITSDKIPLGQKYTPESMTASIIKVMMKYGAI